MKKSIILIIVLALVGVGFFIALKTMESNSNPEITGVLYTIDENDIAHIEITNEYGNLKFSKTDENWQVHSKQSYNTNPDKIELLLASLKSFAIERVLDDQKAEYGLETPVAQVSVTDIKGENYSFSVGNETPSKASVYIKDNKTGKVMIASTADVAQLTGSLQAYRTKSVFNIDTTNIREISFFDNKEHILTATNTGYQNWLMTYPFDAPARKVVLTEFVAKISAWQIASYPKEEETLEEMGLDNPKNTLVLTDSVGNTQTLLTGKDDGTQTYVKIGEGEVVKMYTSDLNFSTLTPEQIVYYAPLAYPINDVAKISIEYGDKAYIYNVNHSTNPPQIKKDGEEVSYEVFASIYSKYITLNATGYDEKQDITKNSVATLTTTLTDGSMVKLTLFTRDESTLYMENEGSIKFYLNMADFEQLIYRIENK